MNKLLHKQCAGKTIDLSVNTPVVASGDFFQGRSLVRCNMIRFITFDFILRVIRAGVMRITFVIKIACVYFYDRTGNTPRF